jgi:hypothetical protein
MAGITKKQIADWKKEHGSVYEFPCEDKVGYLREPNMSDFKRAMSAMQKGGDIAFGETMLNTLWLGGDQEIKTNDTYFLAARKSLVEFFEYEDAFVTDLGDGKSSIEIDGKKCTVRVITREDLRIAEQKNPAQKPFITQEKLFERVVIEQDDIFNDRNNASVRFPLYQAIEKLQSTKVFRLKKL